MAWRAVPQLVDIVVYTSELERDSSPATGRLGSRIVWHAVVDEADALPSPRLRAADSEDIDIGFLERFGPERNIDLLLEGIFLDRRLRLVLAGGGNEPLEQSLRECMSRLGIGPRVEFSGYISAAERPGFFAQIDVLALPSSCENLGMAAAEAMDHGVPRAGQRAHWTR